MILLELIAEAVLQFRAAVFESEDTGPFTGLAGFLYALETYNSYKVIKLMDVVWQWKISFKKKGPVMGK